MKLRRKLRRKTEEDPESEMPEFQPFTPVLFVPTKEMLADLPPEGLELVKAYDYARQKDAWMENMFRMIMTNVRTLDVRLSPVEKVYSTAVINWKFLVALIGSVVAFTTWFLKVVWPIITK